MNEIAVTQTFSPVKGMTFMFREIGDGVQVLFRFPNGAGVSVVRHSGSYGARSGLWEAAPILYDGASWDQ